MSVNYESESERHGIEYLRSSDLEVLSIGVSTGGSAEIKMAQGVPERHIIATTLDEAGIEQAKELILAAGLFDQIETKLEDVSEPLDYAGGHFDYVYARLVLHYLSRAKLTVALDGLHRVTKAGGRLFVVVRSEESDEAKQADNIYDESTGLTTYTTPSGHTATRYFHTVESISNAVQSSGFSVTQVRQYDEMLNASFDRTGMWVKNNVIELLAEKA